MADTDTRDLVERIFAPLTLEPADGANALARFRSNRFAGLLVAFACLVVGNA